MKIKYLVTALVAAFALTIIESVVCALVESSFTLTYFSWSLLSNFLISIVLGYYIVNSPYQSKKLWLLTFIILYVIGNFNLHIEALIFNVTDQAKTISLILVGIPVCLVETFLLSYLFERLKPGTVSILSFLPRKAHQWVLKILAGNFLYFVFYVIAGMFMKFFTPRFDEFYGDKIPPFMTIIMTNLFFRGFVFVGITILIDRTMHGSKWQKAALVGFIFAIVGAIAPLIPPSDHMPDFIRQAHAFEVGISNFLYGISTFLIVRSKYSDK